MDEIYNLCVSTAFGLESVLKKELERLGYQGFFVEDGKIYFKANKQAIARCNVFLRTAERVYLVLEKSHCEDFDTLFGKVLQIKWEDYLTKDSKINVLVKSKKSLLSSVPTLQGMIKKGIINRLSEYYNIDTLSEAGSPVRIEADFNKDKLTLCLDTSGEALHKRGYRLNTGEAPIKETLAAGIILLSNWNFNKPLYDCFCGSGTIPIEAAMIALDKAPGLDRAFAGMKFPLLGKVIWNEAVTEALKKERNSTKAQIFASDIDPEMKKIAQENAENCEVEDFINFSTSDFKDVIYEKGGCIISNPPYGQRMGDSDLLKEIKQKLLRIGSKNKLKLNIFTGDEKFSSDLGFKPKNRKLYNGRIKCYLYQI